MGGRRAAPVLLAVVCVAALLHASGALDVAAQGEETRHTVVWGETLDRIARRYGVTVEAVVEANDLRSSNVIYAGQVLVIPPLPESVVVHVVRPGDSLLSIAHQYGVSIWDIASRNRIRNLSLLFVGEKLVIPGPEEAEPSPTPQPSPTPTVTPEPTPAASPTPGPPAPPDVQEEIVITSPQLNDPVTSPVTVTGWGSGFENSLAVDVLDETGRRIGQGFVVIDAEMGGYGPYDGEVAFIAPNGAQQGRIQVYSISPRDGAIEHLSSVTVQLRP